jgi:hypothetical protein
MSDNSHDQKQIYHHQINKGGLDDILTHGRLKSTEAKQMAGGHEGVRAHQGPFDVASSRQRDVTVIEFTTERPPNQIHMGNGQVRWNVPEGEMLKVNVERAHRNGMTVERPRSEQHLESELQRKSQAKAASERQSSAVSAKTTPPAESRSFSSAYGSTPRKESTHKSPEVTAGIERGLQDRRESVATTSKKQQMSSVRSEARTTPAMKVSAPQTKTVK